MKDKRFSAAICLIKKPLLEKCNENQCSGAPFLSTAYKPVAYNQATGFFY
jgi:hypothetical protein